MSYLVAKTYQGLIQIGNEIVIDKKTYIQVQTKKGVIKTVRTYTQKDYEKMYPNEKKTSSVQKSTEPQYHNIYYKPQKEVLGFTKGYITIFKGDTYAEIDWFRTSIARYARWWGWYIISTEEIPADLPAGLEAVRLPWELVGDDSGKLLSETAVQKAVESLIYEEGTSEFVGSINERLEIQITVVRAIELDNDYGHSTMHIMEDDCGNQYVWTTASKTWAEGSVKTIRGTVKDHRTYKNVKQTVLTRCAER